jgi:hypothetical protein
MATTDKTKQAGGPMTDAAGAEEPTQPLGNEDGDTAHAAAESARRAEDAARRAEQAAGPGTSEGAAAPPFLIAQAAPGGGDTAPPTLFALQGAPQLPAPPGAKRRRDWTFWVPVTALAFIAAAGLLVGMFFIGRGTRPSDDDIASRVQRSVAHQRSVDLGAQRRALVSQKNRLNARFRTRLRREKNAAFQRGKDEGYGSGQAAGYASGQASGRDQGYQQGQSQGYSQGNLDGLIQGLNLLTP